MIEYELFLKGKIVKKKDLSILFISILCIVIFNSCSSTFSFENVVSDQNTLTLERGKVFQTIEKDDLEVSLYAKDVVNETEATIVAKIVNSSETEDYDFDDSFISIYQGNIDDDKWNLVREWNAKSYFKSAKDAATSKAFWRVLDGIIDISRTRESCSTTISSTTYMDSTSTVSYTTSYSSDEYSAIFLPLNTMDQVLDYNYKSLSFLESHLLYPSTIKSDCYYTGVLYFPVDNAYPDYKVMYKDESNEPLNFYFNRSDREEILNPYLDKSRERNGAILSLSSNFDRMDLMMINSSANLFGFYSGISMYNPSVEITELEVGQFQGVGFETGLSLKLFPYTWLLGGMDFAKGVTIPMGENDFSEFYYGPQVGISFIINNLDVSTKFTWLPTISDSPFIDFGIGFAL